MKTMRKFILLSLSAIFLVCGSDTGIILDEINDVEDVSMFYVVSTTPSVGEESVPVSILITVTLSDNLDISTLEGNIIVQKNGISVPGTNAYNHVTRTIIFTPATTLSQGSDYTVLLTRKIKNAVGEEFISDYSFCFTTSIELEPEFDLFMGAISFSTGDTYDFGTMTVGDSPRDIIFTIRNSGTDMLILSGVPYIQVGGSAFSIITLPVSPIPAGNNTDFTVRYNPPSAGNQTNVITIPNNDSNENPYTITATGRSLSGGTKLPEINLKLGDKKFPSDEVYDFKSVKEGDSSVPVTCKIENLGNASLSISSIVLSGNDAGMFILGGLPVFPVSVLPGASVSFTITFHPTEKGNFKKVEVHVNNNDSDENPYIIGLKGKGK